MKLTLNNWTKVFLVFMFLGISVLGFMIKLPAAFRHYDKELHAIFYFLAAGFLNILFSKGKWAGHILIFAILYLFGVTIEYAQEYSNRLLHARIHGRYDPEDIKYNLRGLIAFSVLWVGYQFLNTLYKKWIPNEVPENRK